MYGILVTAPMYFFEAQMNVDFPPAITHPEYYYGFLGVTLAWQILFLIVAKDPVRYRTIILPAVVEKLDYDAAVFFYFFKRGFHSFLCFKFRHYRFDLCPSFYCGVLENKMKRNCNYSPCL